MEIDIIKEMKNELQQKVADLLKEFEINSKLSVMRIDFVRQGLYDNLGNEVDYHYVVEAEVRL